MNHSHPNFLDVNLHCIKNCCEASQMLLAVSHRTKPFVEVPFYKKLLAVGLKLYKNYSGLGVISWILLNFSEQIFFRTTDECFFFNSLLSNAKKTWIQVFLRQKSLFRTWERILYVSFHLKIFVILLIRNPYLLELNWFATGSPLDFMNIIRIDLLNIWKNTKT